MSTIPHGTLTRLDHVALCVPDLEAAIAWYGSVLGLRRAERAGDYAYLTDPAGERIVLALAEGTRGLLRYSVETKDSDALGRIATELTAQQIPFQTTSDDLRPGARAGLRFLLPSGHTMECLVAEPVSYRKAGQWPAGAVPMELSHVQIRCTDSASQSRILVGLGLLVSDVIVAPDGTTVGTFVRINTAHHTMSILDSDRPGFHHVAFEVSPADLLSFADRIVRADARIEYGPGRHGPGNNLFLYVRDPAGNRIELIADMAHLPSNAPTGTITGTVETLVNQWGPQPPRSWHTFCA